VADGGLTVAREALTAGLVAELGPLLREAAAEVYGAPLALEADGAAYVGLAAAGRYGVWVARDAGGAAVGVCGMVLADRHPHVGEPAASQDVLFLARRARTFVAARDFLAAVDRALLESGVVYVYRAAPADRGVLGALYRRAGYAPAETIHVRRLAPWARTT